MARTYLIHTDAANRETVSAYVENQKKQHDEPDAPVETCSADSAANIGKTDPKGFEAVISCGLPKHQELFASYKELGIRATLISTNVSAAPKKSGGAEAGVKAGEGKKK